MTTAKTAAAPAADTARQVSRPVARRFLAIRHLLAPPRSLPPGAASVMTVFERLGSVQFDPLEVAGRNHDLVLLARVEGYRREITDGLLYDSRALYETYNKGLSLVPTTELPWFRVVWDRRRLAHEGEAFDEHAPLVEELLGRIRADGPLSPTDVEPRAAIDWYWRPTNQVRAILEALAESGILGIRRREGNRRIYDLVERLFPPETLSARKPVAESFRRRLLSRYRGHGLLGTSGSAELWLGTYPTRELGNEDGVLVGAGARRKMHAELVEAGSLVPVLVEGIAAPRYVIADEIAILDRAQAEVAGEGAEVEAVATRPGGDAPGVAFLAPLDPFVWDRDFLRRLYDFDYIWEVYVPAPKRRWGYYVLPILFGDRLVGRIEPRIERTSGALRILGVWWEPGFDPLAGGDCFVDAFARAIRAHMAFAGVDRVLFPRTHALRPFVQAVRPHLG